MPIPVDAEPGDLATLEALHQKYQARGLVVLGFPTPEFRFVRVDASARWWLVVSFPCQKPIEPEQIQEKAHALRAEFPLFAPVRHSPYITLSNAAKVRVNGRNAHPLFVFLKAKLPGYLGTKIQYHGTKVRCPCSTDFCVDERAVPDRPLWKTHSTDWAAQFRCRG